MIVDCFRNLIRKYSLNANFETFIMRIYSPVPCNKLAVAFVISFKKSLQNMVSNNKSLAQLTIVGFL